MKKKKPQTPIFLSWAVVNNSGFSGSDVQRVYPIPT